MYNWYRKKHWKLYPSTLYVTLKNIFSYKIDNKPRQRSYTPFQAEIGSDASVKSLTIFSSDGEDNSDLQTNMSALYRLVRFFLLIQLQKYFLKLMNTYFIIRVK